MFHDSEHIVIPTSFYQLISKLLPFHFLSIMNGLSCTFSCSTILLVMRLVTRYFPNLKPSPLLLDRFYNIPSPPPRFPVSRPSICFTTGLYRGLQQAFL